MLNRVSMVLARWCPHCHPASVEVCEQIANQLKVPLRVLDIDDPASEAAADQLVKEHGDYVNDYLIPQVFFEYDDGRVEHVFTGFSEGVHVTKSRWQDFLESSLYERLLSARSR